MTDPESRRKKPLPSQAHRWPTRLSTRALATPSCVVALCCVCLPSFATHGKTVVDDHAALEAEVRASLGGHIQSFFEDGVVIVTSACDPASVACRVDAAAPHAPSRVLLVDRTREGLRLRRADPTTAVVEAETTVGDDEGAPDRALRRALVAVLAPERWVGSLVLDIEPAGATVTLDGIEVGNAPLDEAGLELAPGRHALRVDASGRVSAEGFVNIDEGQTRVLRLRLKPGSGSERLEATPSEGEPGQVSAPDPGPNDDNGSPTRVAEKAFPWGPAVVGAAALVSWVVAAGLGGGALWTGSVGPPNETVLASRDRLRGAAILGGASVGVGLVGVVASAVAGAWALLSQSAATKAAAPADADSE